MSTTDVTLAIDGPIARATFVTDGGLNVLSSTVLDRVHAVAEEVRRADGVRVLVLAAEGKVFVAGADIKELSGLDAAGALAISERGNRAFDAIEHLPCVTIARIHGAALGGGLEVALACDFRIAVKDAKIGLPESSLGLIPGWRGISRVRALGGAKAVRRLTYTAAAVSALEAQCLGVVDDVADDAAGLDAKVDERIAELRRGSPHAIRMIKQALRGGDESRAFADCFAHREAKEGMAAFVEKRPAAWMKEG
ncbi:MAG TPA: enoyl-CoA hydratase-related protein [Phycisphaerae bacterium]|nr:enoyl-CoA hydratase-related protein [Phycisphaerae bacterium]